MSLEKIKSSGMQNKLKDYLKEKGFNICLTAKAGSISCLNSLLSIEEKEKTLVLIGSGGKTLWEKLPQKKGEHPIDEYTLQTMRELAQFFSLDHEVLYPDNQRILPLQQIGRHFNLSHPSPFGPDLSFEFGPWFGFRGVFLTSLAMAETILTPWDSPCTPCPRPCLQEKEFYLARRLCPFRSEHQYTNEQQEYHSRVLKAELSKWQNA
ncbi:hypothetical protein C0V70_09050 [Bacteriovorax stolpii]|uniref:Uncharacterized protein n=2 Tax=Bacteriovorax stolpii TaxID=960 RepID=A0A2K9NRX1_BACTC|nr:hypothetical protein C0V70_09050 [Bacteriovorax stolpii]TDP52170.1 hypothetical protein C8D79_2820 [Bacteriovorax stolpii]